jgi:Holliday junction resolvase
MIDSRDKGMRAELALRNYLREKTHLQFERVPASGALSAAHKLKGDLYIPEKDNVYCIEVKHYAEDQLSTKILTNKNPTLVDWWVQCTSQATLVDKKPLLCFKHDRSKWFCGLEDAMIDNVPFIWIGHLDIVIYNLDDVISDLTFVR